MAAARDNINACGVYRGIARATLTHACVIARVLRGGGEDLPAMDDASLMGSLENWLAPHLSGVKSAEEWRRFDPLNALRAMLDWGQMQRLDTAAPARTSETVLPRPSANVNAQAHRPPAMPSKGPAAGEIIVRPK